MHKSVALIMAGTLASMVPASHATAAGAELVLEEHYSADGYHVDHYITRDADGILSEATLTDRTTGDVVDVWTDGETLWWDGTIAGEHMHGSMPAADFEAEPRTAAFCFTPVTAILCIGVVVLAGASCAHGSWCVRDPETQPPEPSGVPPSGGDGDGDGDGGGDKGSGGGDED